MATLLWFAAVGLELLLLLAIVLDLVRRSRAYAQMRGAVSPDTLAERVDSLPGPEREVATEFVSALRAQVSLDDALVRALIKTTTTTFRRPLLISLLLRAVGGVGILAPLLYALLAASDGIGTAWKTTRGLERAEAVLKSQDSVAPVFEALRSAFHGCSLLLGGMVAIGALGWWLGRPETREARFVATLLQTAARVRPGVPAPVTMRLAAVIAPPRQLARPVVATALWFVSVGVGWLVLYGTASFRVANAGELVFVGEWGDKPHPVAVSDLRLPDTRGGQPVRTAERPTLLFSSAAVQTGQGLIMADLDAGRLVDGWREALEQKDKQAELHKHLASFKAPLEMLVVADRGTAADTIVDLLQYLATQHGVTRFHLVAERNLAIGGQRLQTAIALQPAAEDRPGLRLTLDAGMAKIDDTEVRYGPDWTQAISTAVHARKELFKSGSKSAVRIDAGPGVSYGRLMEAMGAADSACTRPADCGLRGLGVRFELAAP